MVDVRFAFNIDELFKPDARSIPEFILQGFNVHKQFNMWEGFHKVLINLYKGMEKGDEKSQILFKMMAPMLPFYMFRLSGKLDVELDPVDLRILLEMPQAEMTNVNVHDLLTGMSPWGTIDNMELIHNDDEEGE